MSELNITPLLDLVMVLLVIFIITTPQLSNELEMNLPSADAAASTNAPPEINYLIIAQDGGVTLNNRPYAAEQLKEALLRLRARNRNVSVVVRGHEETEYQSVVNVLDVLQQVDITQIGLATETSMTLAP